KWIPLAEVKSASSEAPSPPFGGSTIAAWTSTASGVGLESWPARARALAWKMYCGSMSLLLLVTHRDAIAGELRSHDRSVRRLQAIEDQDIGTRRQVGDGEQHRQLFGGGACRRSSDDTPDGHAAAAVPELTTVERVAPRGIQL